MKSELEINKESRELCLKLLNKLDEQIAELEKSKTWEPKGGMWYISFIGEVVEDCNSDLQVASFGMERQTKEAAEKAAVAMRRFNRLLAYRDEFAPGFEFQHGARNCYMYLIDNLWQVGVTTTFSPTNVYFPPWVANNLCNKLNSDEVIL